MLDKPYGEWKDKDGNPITHAQAVAQTTYRIAVEEGDVQALKLIQESVDGKLPLTIQHTTDDPRKMELSQFGELLAHMARKMLPDGTQPIDVDFTVRQERNEDAVPLDSDRSDVDADLDSDPDADLRAESSDE